MFLFNEKKCADICLKNTNKYVFKAVNDLISDFERVSTFGVKPKIVKNVTQNCIIIEENTRTSAEPVADESYSITTENGNIVIRADGYLGTMWGIYTLSEKFLDVDPCYLFNDLAIVKKNAVELSEVDIADKPDGFGFRGVFINDEDFLQGWKDGGGARLVGGGYYYVTVAKTVIEKVVETVLRLKLNLVIPATFIDLDNPPEKDLADAVAERGIYLSQHHCEPLGVSSFTFENYCKKYGKTGRFSYSECPEIMENVWSFYVDKWAKYDNVVWQIGLRGLGDDRPIWQDDVPTEEVLKQSLPKRKRYYSRRDRRQSRTFYFYALDGRFGARGKRIFKVPGKRNNGLCGYRPDSALRRRVRSRSARKRRKIRHLLPFTVLRMRTAPCTANGA